MSRLFRLPTAVRRDPSVDAWMRQHVDQVGLTAKYWFELMRSCGSDMRECMHDGQLTACVGDAAFAYVAAFKAHVNVGFFHGAEIEDPSGILVGTGKFMRHVKIVPTHDREAPALSKLIASAYSDMRERIDAESRNQGGQL